MKYKLAGTLACLIIMIIALMPSDEALDNNNGSRVHQHIAARSATKAECSHDDGVFCTHLPLVVINTGGEDIPGEPVYDENGKFTETYTIAADGEKTITAEFSVMDDPNGNNHEADKASVNSLIEIHKRGNSSRRYDKGSYDIRLMTEDGDNNPQEIMGMDAHHEWVLYGPYLDKTLIRNYVCYNIAGEIMNYAPNVRFCELILNGEYRGLYLMVETITAGKEGSRLNITVDKKDKTFSGYILRLDRGSDSELKNLHPFSSYTLRTLQEFNIVYPGTSNLNEETAESIRQDFSKFEKALYSYDYDGPEGYKKYIDPLSFADYFIINEFTCNYDAGWLSTYVYKEAGEKLKMCVWDFNSAWDNYQETNMNPDGFQMQNCLWYFMLTKDEDFIELIIDRYKDLRETFLSDEYLDRYIDETIDYLGDAVDRNYNVWGYTFDEEYDMLEPADRNPRSYEESVEQLKDFMHLRGKLMDENIETLRQYCAESKVKKFNENSN